MLKLASYLYDIHGAGRVWAKAQHLPIQVPSQA